MSIEKQVELLRRVPMFANVANANLKLLAFASQRLSFNEGDVIFEQGADGDAAYIIIGGTANVEIDSVTGPVTVATLEENQIVGEIAILCDVPRTATVRAATELTTLRVTKDLFFKLSVEFPQMAVEIMKKIGNHLESTTGHLGEAMAAN